MAGKTEDMNKLHCSFCGKTQDQVKKLIAGPNVYICDECIDLCSDIIEEEYDVLANKDENFNVPKPKEIKETLDEYVIGQETAMMRSPVEGLRPRKTLVFCVVSAPETSAVCGGLPAHWP